MSYLKLKTKKPQILSLIHVISKSFTFNLFQLLIPLNSQDNLIHFKQRL